MPYPQEKGKGRGWHGERERHSMAAKGHDTTSTRIRKIPVKTSNKSLQAEAIYDKKTEVVNVIINDEDKDKNTTYIQSVSVEPKSIEVEENEEIDSMAIKIQGKEEKGKPHRISHTMIIEQQKDELLHEEIKKTRKR